MNIKNKSSNANQMNMNIPQNSKINQNKQSNQRNEQIDLNMAMKFAK